jgi:hypothetical protein
MITNEARCTSVIKPWIVKAKAVFNTKMTLHQQIAIKFKEQTSKVLYFEHLFTVLKLGHFGK